MKTVFKKRAVLIYFLFSTAFVFGQSCTELITNGDFTNFTNVYDANEFGSGQVAAWTSASFTPQIGGAVAHTAPNFAYMWGSTSPVEGIMTNVDIQAGKKYILTYWVKMAHVAPTNIDHFYVKLAPSTFTAGSDIGNIPGSQIISHEVDIKYSAWTMVRVCFKAAANYGKIILYPLGDDWQGSTWVDVDDVSIMEYHPNENAELPCSKCELANDSAALKTNEIENTKLQVSVYPNPSNGAANLTLHLNVAATVSATLYNLNGQAVKTILQNESLETGTSNISIAAGDIAAGTYYCMVQVNEDMYTQKVVIIK